METADEEIVSSTDSDSYIDEFKAEDYNFYIINDEEAKNFILQNCVGAKIKTNTTKKKEFKSEIQTLPGFSCHDRTSRDDELGKVCGDKMNQCKKVSLKDTFVAEVLNDSTKSFIERLHLQEDKNGHIGKETELICSTNSSCMTTSLSTIKNSPREQQSSLLQDNSSMAVSAENSDNSLAYQSEEAQIKSSIEKRNDSRKKYVQKITLKMQGNRSQRGKRKDLCQKDSRSKKKMKVSTVAEIVGNKDSKQGADPNESLVIPENIANKGDENVTSQSEPAVQLSKQFDIHATGNTAEHSYSSTNAPRDSNTLADRDKTDNEWTAENLCLYGLELSEDGVLCDLVKKEEIGDFPTCPHGCIDLTSSEHLFHLHLAALKLAAREKDSQEKIEILSGMNSKYACQQTDSAPEINSEEVHVSLSGRQSEGNIETVQNMCIKENLLNAETTEKISNEKPAKSVDSEKVYQYLNSRQLNGGENKEQQTVITSVQTSLPSAVSYSIPVCNVLNKLSEVGSQWPTSYNRTLPAASAGGVQQVCSIGQEEAVQANAFMYNVMAPTATNQLYQQDIASTLATGSSVTDSFIVSKPHPYSSTPGSYTWYTKQAQPVKNFFTAPHISAHAMNSPWYQQWFHAMNLRRSMASHSPSSACNYFEPLTTNNYRETLWKIPHVTQQRGFILTAPKRLLAGSSENLCLTVHNVTGAAYVEIYLLYPDTDEKITSLKQNVSDTSAVCMKMYIPQTSLSRARLHILAEFDEFPEYRINSVREIHIQHNPLLIFIQTDKPVYRSGQLVRFRVLTLNHKLKPVTQPVPRIWVETPSDVRVAQWLDVVTQHGLVQLELQLSFEPQQGKWKIKVEYDPTSTTHSKIFEVQEYVLPRFEVSIKSPDYILADMSSIQWTICGKYSFGQPVRGTLHVKVESNIPAWRQRTKPRVINLITELDNVEGCFLANVSGSDLGLTDWKIAPSSVILSAHLTEHATNVTANSSSVSPVVHQALKLDFVTFSSHYFKPYLPYSARVKVFHPSGIPAPDETVEVCLSEQAIKERSRKLVVCKNFTSDTDGFVQFVVPPQQQNIVLLSFEAKAVDYQTKYYAANNTWRVLMDQPSSYFDVHAWYSPSHSYITFIPHSSKKIMKCNTINEFKFLFTTKNDQFRHIFYYMVKSRGDLIYFSSTKAHQKYENNTVEEFHNFLSVTNDTRRSVKNETSSDIDSLLYTKQLILNLHIKPEMSPLSYLILYYIHDDGEVVAATHTIQTEMCFENKVTSSFSHQQQVPGLQTMLTIRAAPESLCAMSVVDKRTSYFDSSMRTDYNHAFRELSRFHIDSSSIPHQYDDWEYCSKKQRRKRRSPAWGQRGFTVPPITVYVDAIQAFEEIGVVVLSDLTLETRPCDTLYSHPANEKQTPHQLRLSQRTAKHLDDSGPRTLPDSSPAFSLTEASYSSQSYNNILGYYEHDSYSSMKIRSFFPETWLWDLIYLRDDGIGAVKNLLPHSVTEWVSTILCVSPKAGLGIAPSTSINAFQPFFLDYVLPNSIKRGEVLSLKVVLFNFLTYSLPVKISYSKSISFELLSNDSYASACVAEHSTFFHIYRLKANEIGQINITVTAEVDSLYPDQCGPELIFNSRDTIVKSIVVKPEGFPVEVMKSSFICPGNFTNDSKLWWNLEIPNNVVEDSARAEISVVGDLLAPSLQNLNHLVRLPMGCGEQNMILFAPNVLVVEYMIATNEINPALKEAAIKNMKTGYQRELNYRHEDGSYSAFGKEDSVGSMWLTAFVVKSFSQARKFIFIDDNSLQVSVEWIVKKQLENGCFPLVGQVFQKDIKGGLSDESSSVALTAYVLISLLETGLTIPPAVTSNALYCLRGDTKPDIYTLAISTYAFAMLGEKNLAIKSLHDLMGNAQVQQDLLWWEKLGNPSTSLSVEITAYVILSLLKIGGTENHPNALKAIRWLSKHRNALGGFISTQDTIVGLEALTKFSSSMPPSVTDMKLQVTAAEFSHSFSLQQQNRLLKQQQHIPVLPTQVVIDAEGDGCAMVQVSVHYNVKTPSGTDSFELDVETGPVSSVDLCTVQRVKACLRYKIPNQASNMAVLEVGMVTGYIPDRASLHTLTNDKALSLRRWEEEDDRVNFYFEEISNKRQCITFLVVQKTEIENPKAAIVKLYDYYSPEISISKKYSTDAGCCNERLPLPQPEISNGNLLMDEQYANNSNSTDMTELKINFTTSNMQLQTSNTSLEGLNPQFVNVDHDLDVPSGNEGPDPVYALPQSDSLVAIESEDSPSCPICRDSFFENFGSVYCDSFEVYKLTIRKGGNVRLLLDMSPGRPITRIGKSVLLEIENNCKCKPLEKVGNFVILLERKPKVLNTTGDTTPVLKLDSYSYILRAAQRGYSTALRTARESCDLP